ncbi:hypothetical protein Tco_0973641 [Tanacetum coccineum]
MRGIGGGVAGGDVQLCLVVATLIGDEVPEEMTNAASHMPSSFKRCFSRPIPSLVFSVKLSEMTWHEKVYKPGRLRRETQTKGSAITVIRLGLDHPYPIESFGDLLVFYYHLQHIEH